MPPRKQLVPVDFSCSVMPVKHVEKGYRYIQLSNASRKYSIMHTHRGDNFPTPRSVSVLFIVGVCLSKRGINNVAAFQQLNVSKKQSSKAPELSNKDTYIYIWNKRRSIYIAPLDPLLPFPSATFSSLPQRTRSLPTWKTTEANLNGSFAVPLSS